MPLRILFLIIAPTVLLEARDVDMGLQEKENPPMFVRTRPAPPPPTPTKDFEIRSGYRLVSTLDEFLTTLTKSKQKIRVKPGIYRALKAQPLRKAPPSKNKPSDGPSDRRQDMQSIFAIDGSDNYFDLRGVVFETPVSVMSTMNGKPHVSDSWHVNGDRNTFIGGYFRNIIDKPYPEYRVTDNEFEIRGNKNRFFNCTFVIKGSIPYGYTDFYGKGAGAFGRLNKHCFMSLESANGTELHGCRVSQQSFGHGLHLHNVDGALIKDCFLTGTLRPTDDIYKEKVGRAVEYGFNMMFRKKQPIPRGQVIPLTEDGIRSYNDVRNIKIINTTVERFRGGIQMLCTGNIELKNVTVRETGDFAFDVSATKGSRIIMKDCKSDVSYNPVLNLTRGEIPYKGVYEMTLIDPPAGSQTTERSGLGKICGENCTFIFHNGTTRPLPEESKVLICGENQALKNSTIRNLTPIKLVLEKNVTDCTIESVGPVEDKGKNNTIRKVAP